MRSSESDLRPRRWYHFWRFKLWTDYHREVKHLEIDFSVTEREKQISLIVDDGGFKFSVFFVAATGFLASSFSLFALNVIGPALMYVYDPTNKKDGTAKNLILDEVTLAGTIVGMLGMGHFADRMGRKRLYGLELALVIFATFGIIQASNGLMVFDQTVDGPSQSMDIYSWLIWWRSVLGIGIGAEYPLSAIITAEWASTQSRGTMLAAVFLMQSVSRLCVDGISLGILEYASSQWGLPPSGPEWQINQTITTNGTTFLETGASQLVIDQVWRWIVGVGVIPAAIAIIMRLTIPETPRYYAGIMKDLRKAVQNTLRVYHNTEVRENGPRRANLITTSAADTDEQDEGREHWYTWYVGAWKYLSGPDKAWKTLSAISLLWALLDVCFYGLSMDLSTDLSIIRHDPSTEKSCSGSYPTVSWNSDWWNCSPTIYSVLQSNSVWFLELASSPSVVGGICALFIINMFRRKHILAVTSLLISICLAITGVSLIVSACLMQSHMVAKVMYGILSFLFNLGPNTFTFVIAAEVYPTVYRGTFFGLSAAAGKVGAALIRVIINYRTSQHETSLGIRLLVFIPLMLIVSLLSLYLPDVQVPAGVSSGQDEEGRQGDHNSNTGSTESANRDARSQIPLSSGKVRRGLFVKLKNKALEDIAPNPQRAAEGEKKR
ncbi:major facilitator superfamily domain-containing protein [Coniella lustricola]|uniref:Major facilitator superfamily domain-containing protein n=1 Tax=Coniella lustricola TaxID=2025994 RepID=A0A2T3ALD9_9PEZI|nr:major facilitator superfamily domain-containing protein [Coniella lustricola]